MFCGPQKTSPDFPSAPGCVYNEWSFFFFFFFYLWNVVFNVCVCSIPTYRFNLQSNTSQLDSDRVNQELIWRWINVSVLYFIDFCIRCVGNTFVNVRRSSCARVCLLNAKSTKPIRPTVFKNNTGRQKKECEHITSAHQWLSDLSSHSPNTSSFIVVKEKRPRLLCSLCSSNF